MLATLLLDPVPNTVGYLVAGYIFLLGLPIVYVLSLFVRRRSLERDLELLETLKSDELKRGVSADARQNRSQGDTGPAAGSARQLP